MTPDIEQVKLAIASIAEATLILQQFGGDMVEPTMLMNRGVSEVRRVLNNHVVEGHIRAYRSQEINLSNYVPGNTPHT